MNETQIKIKEAVLSLIQTYEDTVMNDEYISGWVESNDFEDWRNDGVDIFNVGKVWHSHILKKYREIANDNDIYEECSVIPEDEMDDVPCFIYNGINDVLEYEWEAFLEKKYKLYDVDLFKPKQ